MPAPQFVGEPKSRQRGRGGHHLIWAIVGWVCQVDQGRSRVAPTAGLRHGHLKIIATREGAAVTEPGKRPRNRYDQALERDERRRRAEAQEFLDHRPLGQFLVVQFAWGCLGALLGILLGSWTWAVVNFVVFAGAGLLAREFIRRRYARGDADDPSDGGLPSS
jgi:hypothetical protein